MSVCYSYKSCKSRLDGSKDWSGGENNGIKSFQELQVKITIR